MTEVTVGSNVRPQRGASTDELVAFYDANTGLPADELDAAIPAAIDALYHTRDAGGMMGEAGAAAAVAVLEAVREVRARS